MGLIKMLFTALEIVGLAIYLAIMIPAIGLVAIVGGAADVIR